MRMDCVLAIARGHSQPGRAAPGSQDSSSILKHPLPIRATSVTGACRCHFRPESGCDVAVGLLGLCSSSAPKGADIDRGST